MSCRKSVNQARRLARPSSPTHPNSKQINNAASILIIVSKSSTKMESDGSPSTGSGQSGISPSFQGPFRSVQGAPGRPDSPSHFMHTRQFRQRRHRDLLDQELEIYTLADTMRRTVQGPGASTTEFARSQEDPPASTDGEYLLTLPLYIRVPRSNIHLSPRLF